MFSYQDLNQWWLKTAVLGCKFRCSRWVWCPWLLVQFTARSRVILFYFIFCVDWWLCFVEEEEMNLMVPMVRFRVVGQRQNCWHNMRLRCAREEEERKIARREKVAKIWLCVPRFWGFNPTSKITIFSKTFGPTLLGDFECAKWKSPLNSDLGPLHIYELVIPSST